MSDIKNVLSSLIESVRVIITNCTNAEDLLLSTKASSTLLTSANQSLDSINQRVDKINEKIITNEAIGDCIESLFSLYEKIVNESTAIIDIYMIAKSLKGLMDSVFDSIILIDSTESNNQINALIEKTNKIIDLMLSKINTLSDKIEDSQSGYFASKLISDVKAVQNKATDTQLHFQSIEQLNIKLDSSISQTNNAISTLSSTINSISTRLTDTHTLLNSLINNKANPHEVTKAQVGLEHALNAYKSDDVETNDANSVHSAKATNQIWEKAKSDIGDCPNDGKYYVRQNGQWVEGIVTDSVPVGTVVGYTGLSAPKGYLVLECNTIHSRSLYPALYDHLKFHCPELIIDSLSFRLCSGEEMFLRGVVSTVAENLPKNLNVLWIIKAFDRVNKPAIIEAESVVQQVSNNTVEIQRLEPIVSSNTENIKTIKNPDMGDRIVTCSIKYKYEHSFIVEGDLNTYYPVYLMGSTNYQLTKIEIYRYYDETGPEEFGTHKATLSAVLYAVYGGWGGNECLLKLFSYSSLYNTTFANAAVNRAHGIGLCVWLRGGGMLYHIESDQYFHNLIIGYTTDTAVYVPAEPQYATVYADPSLTAVNQSFLDTAFIT